MHRNLDWTGKEESHGSLPRPNRRLTALAQDVARLAQPLLPAGGDLFLGLEATADGQIHLVWWRQHDFKRIATISATPDAFCPEDSDEGALQDAAAALLDYLAGRWPTPPGALGVITDGVGVAFAPDHPSPSADSWLLRHATGESTLAMILDLDPAGPCGLLIGGQSTGSFH
ncbi:hypothetical protein HNP52_003257 [Sphingomonas kyeonggiensis]|uniref:Uncharacterized protein n=1 Tax=Sphingomonas kyeonggiensis TaxID=1268553 RepID=A0A7W7K4A4_9SPHN|nr:hypothetical protein [Sphingomonas kyeonggiensis]MBB4840165.1 hypothetical protein [Sphingomonas kyeonggiensis]